MHVHKLQAAETEENVISFIIMSRSAHFFLRSPRSGRCIFSVPPILRLVSDEVRTLRDSEINSGIDVPLISSISFPATRRISAAFSAIGC